MNSADSNASNTDVPDPDVPDPDVPDPDVPDTDVPDTDVPDTGDSETGDSDMGDSETGDSETGAAQAPPLLKLVGISHSFPGTLALDDVSLALHAGQVHALMGENGAGKTTLINILSGVLHPDRGSLLLEDRPVVFADPAAARRAGIATVHQEAELFPDLSVAENMALMHNLPTAAAGMVDRSKVRQDAADAFRLAGEELDVSTEADSLGIAQRQLTQIANAIFRGARVVIFDEPTSALSAAESERLFAQIRELQERGAAVLYISHRQDEVFRLADWITVLRDGRRVWTRPASEVNSETLIDAMVGRELSGSPARRANQLGEAAPLLRVEKLADAGAHCKGVSLELRPGEIVGLYGLVGSGRSEFAQTLFGLQKAASGVIEIDGQPQEIHSPQQAVAAGLAYVPEDRLRQALCRDLSLRANMVLSSLPRWMKGPWVSVAAERQATSEMLTRFDVRHQSMEQSIGELSGGNQQKVVLGRWLLSRPKVLLLDEPTRGVDVGAKDEIHRILRQLAAEGVAVLLITSELEEAMQHTDRVLVFREGTVAGEFDPSTVPSTEVGRQALPTADTKSGQAGGPIQRRQPWFFRSELALAILVIGLAVLLGSTTNGFSLNTLLTNASVWIVLGLAAATVMIAGGIDISLGSLLALSGISAAFVLRLPWPIEITIPLSLIAAMLVGGLGGLLNGCLTLVGRIHPIVVTLGTMTIYRGLAIGLLGGQTITGLPAAFKKLAINPDGMLQGAVILPPLVAIVVFFWLTCFPSGRYLYAVGSSTAAARLAGVSRSVSWLRAFTVGGVLCGLAGAMQLALSGSMQSHDGTGWELNAIAVAVIGGVSITGGRGSILGVVLGALLLRLINSLLIRQGVTAEQFDLFVGALILIAVLLDLLWKREHLRTAG